MNHLPLPAIFVWAVYIVFGIILMLTQNPDFTSWVVVTAIGYILMPAISRFIRNLSFNESGGPPLSEDAKWFVHCFTMAFFSFIGWKLLVGALGLEQATNYYIFQGDTRSIAQYSIEICWWIPMSGLIGVGRDYSLAKEGKNR